jgi:CIC family chloride channel protein
MKKFIEIIKLSDNSQGIHFVYWIAAGILAGIASVIFYFLCNFGHTFFLGYIAGYTPPHPAGDQPLFEHAHRELNKWLLWLMPAAGGLLSGLLVYFFCPEAQGHGTDSAIDAYHEKNGIINPKVPIVKTFASFLTLGTGGSGGSEGPICQIGAGLGSYIAQKFNLTPRETRILMVAGMGAGIGSIFRAPLTGALFASEILYKDPEFEAEVIIPATISSITAYSIFCTIYGWGSMFKAEDFRFTEIAAIGPYIVLSLALAAGIMLFVKCFWGIHDFAQKVNIPSWSKPVIGGLMTGAIGIFLPQVLGFSYGFIQEGLDGKVTPLLFLIVAIAKIFATSFSIGSGGSGGVFGPTIVIGGAIGGAVGGMFHLIIPDIVPSAGPFIIVGMAGMFAGSSNVPITAIIVVSEITSSYHLLLPSMLVCSLSYFLCRPFNLYRAQVENKFTSPAHKGAFFTDILEDIKVKDIFDDQKIFCVIPEDMSFSQFCKFFQNTEQHYFPVVNQRGKLSGIFSINDIRHLLFENDELGSLVIVKDVARQDVITTHPEEDINTLLKKFTIRNIDKIPVVSDDDPTMFLGMISRREVIAFYNEKLNEKKSRKENS